VSRECVYIVAGLFPDRIGCRRTGEGASLGIVAMNKAFDFGDQFFDAAEGPMSDGLLRVRANFRDAEGGIDDPQN
jgi:hypothetical protein